MLPIYLASVAVLVVLAFAVVGLMKLLRPKAADSAILTVEQKLPMDSQLSAAVDPITMFSSPYNWSNLSKNDYGLWEYTSAGKKLSREGIDVSEHNGKIDWEKVKAAGIDFAYIRLGYRGTELANIVEDAKYRDNMEAAAEAGLKLGVYFFSQATTADEAKAEADFVVEKLADYQLDYPIAFDFEPDPEGKDRISSLTSEEKTEVALAFCTELKERGYRAIVYGNQYDLMSYDMQKLADFGFWYAEYESKPSYELAFAIWQYSHTAHIAGVDTPVDLNLGLFEALPSAN